MHDQAESVRVEGRYVVVCHGPDGKEKWRDHFPNLVTNVGRNAILDAAFKTGLASPSWFLGLVDGGSAPTYAAADTMASHAGWTENTGYSNASRPACSFGAVASQSVTNSGSVAVFNINATSTIAGCFLVDNSSKGGSSGTLMSAGNFTGGNKSVSSGDTLSVTYTMSD